MRSTVLLLPAALAAASMLSILASPASAGFTLVRSYDGLVPGAEFGTSCVVIGDMDGDGIDDFAIGAPGDDTGGADAGRVFIYRGGHPLADDPSWVITGAPGERLGHSLAAADVDGDGRMDLLIGAPGSVGAPATLTGRVAIAFGGNPLGGRALANIPGITPDGRFGASVAGLSEYWTSIRFLVGAPDANGGAGEVHAYAPGNSPGAPALSLHGRAADEQFGYALASAGITRGAIGGPEFLVGSPGASANGPRSGRFDLFQVDTPNDTLPTAQVMGSAGSRLGESVTGGVDINPNFFEETDDLVVGAPGADPGGLTNAGSSLVYANQAPYAYDGNVAHANLGATVRLTRDITGSALPDLAVGEAEAVRVYTGPLNPGATPAATLVAETLGDGFGRAISNGGRIDPSTARSQFLIGAPLHDGVGRVYVYTDLSVPTGVGSAGLPQVLSFSAPSPNPSPGAFAMAIELPRPTTARLSVLDVTGRRVATLHDGPLGAGRVAFTWTPRRADSAGIYWGVLETDDARLVRRMVRVR
jgi:hypothetical protein